MDYEDYENYIFPGEEIDPIQRRQQLFDKMNPQLKDKVHQVKTWFDLAYKSTLLDRYQLGLLVQEIYDDDYWGKDKRYGDGAVRKLEQYFAWGRDVLRPAYRLVCEFTREEIDQVLTLRTSAGEPISYTHLRVLFPIKDKAVRWELLDRVIKENLTAEELDKLVLDMQGLKVPGVRRSKRGRPLSAPRDFEGIYRQQEGYCQDFLQRSFQVWEAEEFCLAARAEALNPTDVTDQHLEKARHLADLLSQVSQKAQERAEEAKRVHEHFQKILDDRFGWADKLKSGISTHVIQEPEQEEFDREDSASLVAV